VESLFETVRAQASRAAWSRGVELARAGAVVAEHGEADELTFRVRAGGLVQPTVIVYTSDPAWECDCAGLEDPCEHVAAVAIALRQAKRAGRTLPGAHAAGRVGYRFTHTPEGLVLERVVVGPAGERPLRTTLTALASGRVDGPEVLAGQADLAVELALGPRRAGVLPRGVLRSLLVPLADCADVTLDGRPVRASAEPVEFRVRVSDDPGGFRVRVEPDPPLEEDLGEEVALCAGVLRPIGPTRLTGRERDDLLGSGRVFPLERATELVAEILPGLETRLPVLRESARLPGSRLEPPRLVVDVAREGSGLSLLATIVYGDPPTARIDAGRLTHLRGPVPRRDEEAEGRLVARLRSALGMAPGHRISFDTDASLEIAARLARLDAEIRGDAHEAFFPTAALVPHLRLEGDRLDLAFEPAEPPAPGAPRAGRADAAAVLGAWRSGASVVALEGGGVAPLPADWLARHGARVADLLAARDRAGRLPRAALPQLARLCDALGAPRPAALAGLERLVDEFEALPAAALPPDLRAALRPYQRAGVDWLCFLGGAGLGALLADDMGLGKTVQALCALRGRSLVVAPTSLLGNWAEEIARFRPALRVATYHGADRDLEDAADVTLTTYALLRRDVERLTARPWTTVILDEAQTIKNPESQVAQAAWGLVAERRIALTGTPVENHLADLWSQMHFLNPGLLGSRAEFEERTAGPLAEGDPEAAARLAERIRPFVLRRRKRDVAPELPPRTDVVLRVELSETERAVYDTVRAASVEPVVRALREGGSILAALEALLRLRQACCHPGLVPGQSEGASSKLALLLDRLETAHEDGHRALVFSQWTALLDRVEPLLREAGLDFVRLDGSTRDRAAVVRRFQAEDGPPVFLISLRAGGSGLNLAAADHVFLLDPWWNPAVEDQAADRAHRIGQDRPVLVHRLVARDTVEERILALQAHKRELAEAVLGDEVLAARLTRDDLLALLGA
jgi:superfamily II DNA or RNA helicase